MTQFFAQFAGNNAGVARPTGPEAIYERFMKMRPKEFSGTTDPMISEGWIKSLEVIFEFMGLGDEDRVCCATYLLGGDAHLWLTREFMTLRQGDLTVTEFIRKFERSCHFVPLIANDARAKLMHFLDGLRPILCHDVRVAGLTTYDVAVSRALAVEQDLNDIEKDRQAHYAPVLQRKASANLRRTREEALEQAA
ncbi:uncharacterized protein [Primulina eburnea]|uniref:uncharacterized protein n=1 Tax=Primulina eburnea TaxID=1245227 RepID=UPI003C6BE56C